MEAEARQQLTLDRPNAYCTYFDSAYASRGRILVHSLRSHGGIGPVYVLALDEEAARIMADWDDLDVTVVLLSDLEAEFPELLAARADRSAMEYVFTLTPWLTRWVMRRVDPRSWVTYLDADMAFFSSPQPLYNGLHAASVAIVEHRFTWEQAWRARYGRFNVAWVGFRNDPAGRECLEWWADRCLEWCRDEVSEGRFADQGYLDQFPLRFTNVSVIQHPGADVAPWNLRRHELSVGQSEEVLVDGQPLIFFHFHGLRVAGNRFFFKHLPYFTRTTNVLRDRIYGPYCQELAAAMAYMGAAPTALGRRPTLLTSLRSGRAAILTWLGERRGDYVDVAVE